MQIFNATELERTFFRSDRTPIRIQKGSASTTELATPDLIKSVYETSRDANGRFVLGLILAKGGFEKDKVDETIGNVEDGFIFQSEDQARAVLMEGKDFSIDLKENVQLGYELKFESLKKDIAEKDVALTELKGKLENFKRHDAERLDKISELNNSLEECKGKLEAAENKLSAARKEIAEKELACKQAEETAKTYKRQAESKQTDINALNATLTAARKNTETIRERLAKAEGILADLQVFYDLEEVEPGVWRARTGLNEAENTVLLSKLVERLGLVMKDGEYVLPSEMATESSPQEHKTEKKK